MVTLKLNGEDLLVGASGLFAQNASVQLNLEVMGTYASTSGNLSFNGEIMPDGVTCAVNDILKRTGANDWDCATDATGGGGAAFGGIELTNSGTAFGTHYGSISFDAGHFTLGLADPTASATYLRLDWTSDGGPASLSQAETITGNWVNTTNPWADNEVIDAISIISGIIGANSISGTQTTTGTTTFGDNGDSIIFDASNWDISTLGKADFLSASVSANFEAIGYASASKYFGIALTGMAGTDGCSAAGDTLNYTASTGLFSCGSDGGGGVTSDSLNFDEFQNPLVLDVNVTVSSTSTGYTWNWQSTDVIIGSGAWDFGGADSLEIPTGANPTIDKLGEIGGQVPSASEGNFFRIHDGTAERVLQTRTCFGVSYGLPTAKDHITFWNAYNPFTINNVYMVSSGSNAAGWQIRHSRTNASFTNLFVTNKAASGANEKIYTTTDFSDNTLLDGERVDFVITSASAVIDNVYVRVCGFYDP